MRRPGLALCPLALAPILALAQQTVAPTGARVGEARGEDVGDYNVLNSFETGYRFLDVGGNRGKYRSDVNFRNGIRLLSSSLSVNSKEGRARWFDTLQLNTQGLGNDPYQYSNLRVEKNALYRYDLIWRSSDYFNPALGLAQGWHAMDTTRRLQDHDFTLFPLGAFRFFAGFSRATQSGPALSSVQLFDSRGDEYPLFSNVDRRQNEFRIGSEVRLAGFKLHWIRAWESYREDTPALRETRSSGANPTDNNVLNQFKRTEPWEGSTPSWRVSLLRDNNRYWGVNARFTHSDGQRDFAFDETAIGTNRFGGAVNRQVLVAGTGRRPVTAASLTLSLFPAANLTVTNHSGFHNTRIEGDARLQELDNGSLLNSLVSFNYLGIRTFTNQTDALLRITPRIALRGGYWFANRRIRSTERESVFDFANTVQAQQTNTQHAGVAGLRLQPVRPLTLVFDAEIGRNDRPFSPISDRDYHAFHARAQWKQRSFAVTAFARTNYNFNTTSLLAHSSRSRNYSANLSWLPRDWFTLDAGYSKLHLDTATGIAYFASGRFVQGERSIYRSNLHAGHFGARFAIRSRIELYTGYSHTQDSGDGRSVLETPPAGLDPGSSLALFRQAQTFPMRFLSPLARVSVRINSKLRWNVGYQYYGYGEELLDLQGYRAHSGYTSVLWSF